MKVSHHGLEMPCDVLGSPDLKALARPEDAGTASQLEGRDEGDRLDGPHPVELHEIAHRSSGERLKRVVAVQERLRKIDGRGPPAPRSEKYGEQFRVGERSGAALYEAFPRTFLLGPVTD